MGAQIVAAFNLQPGESRTIPLSGRYLVARRVSGNVACDDPNTQLPEFSFRQGDNIEFPQSVTSVRVANRGATVASLDVESSPVRIYGNEGSAVSIIGGEITRIVEPIAVTAEATVQNGTVISQSQTTMSDAVDVTIAANSRVKVVSADASERRTVILQNISAALTSCRVGGATVAANRGLLLAGSISAPAALEFDCKGDIWVWNASASVATFAVMWGAK